MAKSKLTPDIRSKIEEIAALDGSVEEMAYYCDLNKATIYNWLNPESPFFDEKLADRVEKLRARPVLKARQTINKRMEESYSNAVDYLKRKKKDEFGDQATVTLKTPTPLLDNVLKEEPEQDA